MPFEPPVFDHAVITVGPRLDEAADTYRRLGFTLTPRGHHSLGSINHLAMFRETYLELLGHAPGQEPMRAEIWRHPPGLTGLAFRTSDAAARHADAAASGVPVDPVVDFSRPVALADGERLARFRTFRTAGDVMRNGRAFFCQHRTPELLWRDEWRRHPNDAVEIIGFAIGAKDPSRLAQFYASLFGQKVLRRAGAGFAISAGAATVTISTPEDVAMMFDGAAATSLEGEERMLGLTLRVGSLALASAFLSKFPGLRRFNERIIAPADVAGCALAFMK